MAASIKIPTIFTAVDKFSDVVKGMTNTNDKMAASLSRLRGKMDSGSRNMATGGIAIAGGMGIALNSATKFEDKMADISKTTGLEGKELDSFGGSILDMSKKTRTSIEDLQGISVIGGQLGVAKDELLAFTEAGNKFSVALAGDYSGGLETAVLSVGKLNSLYSDTKSLKIDEHLNRAGSAFNGLSSDGKSSAENINDFASRVGTLPSVLRPSFTATAALGAFLEEAGINSERGASGFSTLLLTAGKNLPNFARQMGMGTDAARELLEQDPVKFAQKFSRSLNGLKPDELSNRLKDLGIGGQESIKVVGALGDETNRLNDQMDSSSKLFNDATSLTDEYKVKNETTAAKIAMARNNMEALSITIGTQLAPILSSLIDKVIPVIDSFGKWIQNNPKLSKGLAFVGATLIGLAIATKGVSLAMGIGQGVMLAYTAITNAYAVASVAAAISGTSLIAVIWATVWPILAVIAAIGAIIAIFYYWDEIMLWFSEQWTTFVNFIGGLWDSLTTWFQEFDFLEFFKGIGNAVIDFFLGPLEDAMELLSEITESIGNAVGGIFGGDVDVNSNGEALPSTTQASSANVSRSISESYNNVKIDIADKGGNVGGISQSGDIPISLTNTSGSN
tara:strand:+ start:168 stop:2030 length:1863 start_codon:yes stop_codon:yes gene_type:complete